MPAWSRVITGRMRAARGTPCATDRRDRQPHRRRPAPLHCAISTLASPVSCWHGSCVGPRAMRPFYLLPLVLSLGACGGNAVISSEKDGSAESGMDAGAEPDACVPGSDAVINCHGVFLYCCPPHAHCLPPPCDSPDAGDAAPPPDAAPGDGGCPVGEYLLVPCCGGYDNTACSNGPGPPPPFCSALPASCSGQSACEIGGCSGTVDPGKRTVECNCL
jgi:hypothetical protein